MTPRPWAARLRNKKETGDKEVALADGLAATEAALPVHQMVVTVGRPRGRLLRPLRRAAAGGLAPADPGQAAAAACPQVERRPLGHAVRATAAAAGALPWSFAAVTTGRHGRRSSTIRFAAVDIAPPRPTPAARSCPT